MSETATENTATTETVVTTDAAPETKTTGAPETTVSETTTATAQESKDKQQDSNWDFDKLVSTIATLVKPEPKPEAQPKAEPGAEQEAQPKPAEDSQYRQIEEVLHTVLVTQANVPEALKPLLPKGISELQEFLNSDSYRQLASALKPVSPSAKPAETDPAPAPQDTPKASVAPKTVQDLDLSVLAELDRFFL